MSLSTRLTKLEGHVASAIETTTTIEDGYIVIQNERVKNIMPVKDKDK